MHRYVKANIAFSKFSREYTLLKKSLSIRPSEMGLLNIICQPTGHFTPVKIAELLGVSRPMVAAHIASLEKQGYVHKCSSSSDKRSFYVLPTEKARRLAAETEATLNGHLKALETALGPERFALLVTLTEEAHAVLAEKEGA